MSIIYPLQISHIIISISAQMLFWWSVLLISVSLSLSHSSDSAAMASGPPDVTVNQEPAEAVEECSGNSLIKCLNV